MASTWGNNTWGSNEWQDDVILITPTGFSTTASVGTVEAFNTKGWGRDDFGNGAWGVEYSVELSGQSATSSVGSITTEVAYTVSIGSGPSDQMRSNYGDVTVDTIEVAELTGVQSEFATPTLSYVGTLVGWGRDGWGDNSWGESPDQVIPLVGQELTSSVGSPTLQFTYELSGQEATTSIGSPTVVLSPTISVGGVSATSSLGTLGLEFGPAGAVSGVSSTSAIGSVGLEFGPAEITGVGATSGVGSLEIGSVELVDPTGVSATSGVGSINIEMAYELGGQGLTTSVDSFDNLVDVTQGLTTDPITSSVGILAIEAYGDVDTGSNTSYSNVSTGSNDTYSDVATGSNTSYSGAA